ncbi:MAG: hypothetical protein S4CHLAM6_13910 [Chlamydiae bacterium]|nr:hypothetical protein [Chlamydiota bacterium]
MVFVSPNLNPTILPISCIPSNLAQFNLPAISELAHQTIEYVFPDIVQSKLDQNGYENCKNSCFLWGKAAAGCLIQCAKLYNEGSLSSHRVDLLT